MQSLEQSVGRTPPALAVVGAWLSRRPVEGLGAVHLSDQKALHEKHSSPLSQKRPG